jgi:hypothetical protein
LSDLAEFSQVEQLERANISLQRQLATTKAKTVELVAAVERAAREAFTLAGGYHTVPAPEPDRRRKGVEAALWVSTDFQGGKSTESYGLDVLERRVALFNSKCRHITEIQRADHPVPDAWLLWDGDMIENCSIFPGQVWEIEADLFTQVFRVANILEAQVRYALETYQRVHVVGEWGNHGRLGKKSDGYKLSDNWDRILYRLVADRFKTEKRVTFQFGDGWYQRFEIGKYHAVAMHGDEIKSFGGNCVTPEVRVLTRDLRWVEAGDLRVGDRLLAFTEDGSPVRHYQDAKVTSTGIAERPVWRITFDDGSFVRCTAGHAWIVSQTGRARGGTNRQIWMRPDEIAERIRAGGRKHTGAGVWMFQPVAPWSEPANDYDSGFLAGAFDADGCLSKGPAHPRWPIAEFAQYPNALYENVKRALDGKGFHYKERTKPVRNGRRGDIQNLELAKRDDTLRFLGQTRPPRLLDWWMNRVDVNILTFTRKSTSGTKRIVSCEPDGSTGVCTLSSSSGTYITEYGPAHNTPAFGIIRKGNSWASGVIPHFHDLYLGHFHTHMDLPLANGGHAFVTGSTESDSLYAQEFVAATGTPSQRLHFVDPERGRVTAAYQIYLGDGD